MCGPEAHPVSSATGGHLGEDSRTSPLGPGEPLPGAGAGPQGSSLRGQNRGRLRPKAWPPPVSPRPILPERSCPFLRWENGGSERCDLPS